MCIYCVICSYYTFDSDLSNFYLKDDHVIIEEPHEDDVFDYTNMPPLVNFTSPLLISNTDPPFIYQYVGNQIKIIKLLDNYPLTTDSNQNNNPDNRDQKEALVEIDQPSPVKESTENNKTNEIVTDKIIVNMQVPGNIQFENYNDKLDVSNNTGASNDIQIATDLKESCDSVIKANINTNDRNQSKSADTKVSEEDINAQIFENTKLNDVMNFIIMNDNSVSKSFDNNVPSELIDATLDPNVDISSINDVYDSAESDDESSFGTPVSSPNSGRKVIRGKYGKDKAPPPPKETHASKEDETKGLDIPVDNLLNNVEERIQNIDKDEKQETNMVTDNLNAPETFIVNDVAEYNLDSNEKNNYLAAVSEKERMQKSKSPMRHSKGSAFGKLLQLPGKLAFWHKTDEKSMSDNVSNASDSSRKSSLDNNIIDAFQSCSDLNFSIPGNEGSNQITEELSTDNIICRENISKDISLKTDALQQVINAKLEEIHPDYKFVSLHDEIPTTSKSTDV